MQYSMNSFERPSSIKMNKQRRQNGRHSTVRRKI